MHHDSAAETANDSVAAFERILQGIWEGEVYRVLCNPVQMNRLRLFLLVDGYDLHRVQKGSSDTWQANRNAEEPTVDWTPSDQGESRSRYGRLQTTNLGQRAVVGIDQRSEPSPWERIQLSPTAILRRFPVRAPILG